MKTKRNRVYKTQRQQARRKRTLKRLESKAAPTEQDQKEIEVLKERLGMKAKTFAEGALV